MTPEERTRAFYDFERRGRGWLLYDEPIVLEPPFRPFARRSHRRAVDDGRRHTFLSGLFASLRGEQTTAADPDNLPAEPEVEPFAWQAPLVEVSVALPSDVRTSRAAAVSWLEALSTSRTPTSFELVGAAGQVSLRLAFDEAEANQVVGALETFVPGIELRQAPQTLAEQWFDAGRWVSVLEFGLAREFMVPLVLPDNDPDPLTPLVATLRHVAGDALGVVQVLFASTRAPWEQAALQAVVTPSGQPFFADAPEVTSLAKEKLASPLMAVVIRLAAKAGSDTQAWSIVRQLAGGFSQFGSPTRNELIPLASEDLGTLEEDLLTRTSHRSGMLLSARELAGLVHLPGPALRMPSLGIDTRTRRPPNEVLQEAGVLLGESEHRGERFVVRLPTEARMRHLHVVGATGTGKSNLLAQVILEDIAGGHGLAVIDPHGDLIDEVLGRLPEERDRDVILFDPADPDYVVGWNMLSATSTVEKELLASDLVGVFRRLSTSWGDQMTSVLQNALLAFLESTRGGTLLDLRQFLVDDAFRRRFLQSVPDEHLRSFWDTEYPLIAGRKPQAPILTRLDTLLRTRLVREVVTERERHLDFADVVNQGRIFLAKLSQGAIGEENAALLGSLVVSRFHQATLARSGERPEERRPFFLYLDEFHQVATPSMASLFSGARKFAMGVTVAHQGLHQLHSAVPEVERAVLGNAYTRICFRVGDEDARALERGFAHFDADALGNLETGRAICRVGRKQADFVLETALLQAVDPAAAALRREELRQGSGKRYGRKRDEPPPSPPEETPPPPTTPPGSPRPVGEASATAVEQQAAPPPAKPPKKPTRKKRPPPPPGRGGPEHTYLQSLIRQWGQERGYKVSVEEELPDGGRVDVALSRGEERIACEISVTTDVHHEVGNVRKCLSAGFNRVAVVSLKRPFLRKLQAAVSAVSSEDEISRLSFFAPEEFLSFLANEPAVERGETVAGYRVKTTYRPSKGGSADRRKRVADVIAKGLRRLRKER